MSFGYLREEENRKVHLANNVDLHGILNIIYVALSISIFQKMDIRMSFIKISKTKYKSVRKPLKTNMIYFKFIKSKKIPKA